MGQAKRFSLAKCRSYWYCNLNTLRRRDRLSNIYHDIPSFHTNKRMKCCNKIGHDRPVHTHCNSLFTPSIMLGASQSYQLNKRDSMINLEVKISRSSRPRRPRAAGAWRWPTTQFNAKVEERVELYLYSPSGSVNDTEQIKRSHHFVRFPTSRYRDLHFVTSSQVVLTRCTQEGGRPVTSCRAQSVLSVERLNSTQSCIRPRNCVSLLQNIESFSFLTWWC
jgi:hypothetical protein